MTNLVLPLVVLCLSSCAAMHHVTGDPIFAPEPKPVVRGPNVPEPEPTDTLLEEPLKPRPAAEDELAPLPQPASKQKPGKKIAAAR